MDEVEEAVDKIMVEFNKHNAYQYYEGGIDTIQMLSGIIAKEVNKGYDAIQLKDLTEFLNNVCDELVEKQSKIELESEKGVKNGLFYK